MKISINSHSSIQADDLFFDPYNIDDKPLKVYDTKSKIFETCNGILSDKKVAKYVLITHSHFDHLSIEDINKVIDENTVIIATPDAKTALETNFKDNNKFFIRPNEAMELDGITISTFCSYNKNKDFHKKENGWVGYKVTTKDETFAVLGDTDFTDELKDLSCDILFIPIGGTYTMTASEAAEATNIIKPDIVVPSHYNSLVGSKKDEEEFLSKLDKNITPIILID